MVAGATVIGALLRGFFPNPLPGQAPPTLFDTVLDVTAWGCVAGLGYFMFKGANWARLTFFAFTAVIIVGLFASGLGPQAIRLIWRLAPFCVAFALPGAHRFYTGQDPHRHASVERERVERQKEREAPKPHSRRGDYDY